MKTCYALFNLILSPSPEIHTPLKTNSQVKLSSLSLSPLPVTEEEWWGRKGGCSLIIFLLLSRREWKVVSRRGKDWPNAKDWEKEQAGWEGGALKQWQGGERRTDTDAGPRSEHQVPDSAVTSPTLDKSPYPGVTPGSEKIKPEESLLEQPRETAAISTNKRGKL